MSTSFKKINIHNVELELEIESNSLAEKARKIGFSTEEIEELHRVYVARRKVRK